MWKINRPLWRMAWCISVCSLFLICGLTACGGNDADADSPTETDVSMELDEQAAPYAQGSNLLQKLLEPAKLPEEYLITYEVEENGLIQSITEGMDRAGNVYFCSGGEAYYYEREDGHYRLYQPDSTGRLIPDNSALYTWEHIRDATSVFNNYAEQSAAQYNGVAEWIGTEQIEGRTCDVYQFEVSVVNFITQYELAVDQETGICMRWDKASSVSGYSTDQNGSFRCVQFVSENVELPVK